MAVGGVAADVVADGDGFGSSLRRILARYQNESVNVNLRVDDKELGRRMSVSIRQAGVQAQREADQAGERSGRSFADRFRSTVGRGLAGIAGSLFPTHGLVSQFGLINLSLLGSIALVAASNIAAFASALAPAVGILATLPSVLGVAAAGLTTLIVAFRGVGDAFSAALGDDAAAFEEALEGISPAAADTARALRDVAPAWSDLREAVQESFFDGLADQLTAVSDALAGPLQASMSAAASSLSDMTSGLADVVASAEGVDFISGSFDTLSNVIDNISAPMADLLDAIFSVGNAINEAFGGETAGSGLANMIQSFADWLDAAADSGEAVQWVEDAMTVFSEIGAILAPIGGIFASIGNAAEDASGGILGALGMMLQLVDDFLKSAEGVAFLEALFETIGALGAALGPILAALGSALAPLGPIIADIFTTLGPGIETLIGALGEGLAALGPSLVPLAAALVSIVDAVAPLLPLLGTWIALIVEVAAFILTALAPALELIVTLFTSLYQPQTELLLTVLSELFAAMAPVITDVADAAFELIAPLTELQQTIMDTLLPAIMELLPVFTQLATDVGEQLVDAILQLLPPILDLTTQMVDFYVKLQPVLIVLAQFAAFLMGNVANGISIVVGWIASLIAWTINVGNAIDDFGRAARTHIESFVDGVVEGFQMINTWIGNLVQWFIDLPGRIIGAIGNLGSQIWDSITSGFGDLGEWLGFANGGIITSPTFAALAEDGNPEVVIPLTKPARAQQLAQESGLMQILNVGSSEQRSPASVTINVNGGDLREVRRTIEDVMAEYA